MNLLRQNDTDALWAILCLTLSVSNNQTITIVLDIRLIWEITQLRIEKCVDIEMKFYHIFWDEKGILS